MASTRRTDGRSPDAETADAKREFETAQRVAFEAEGVSFESRYVDLDSPACRVHVVDAGEPSDEPPLVFVHGVMNFGAMFAPLMGRLGGARMLALDRPGWGLSDDFRYDADTQRRVAVDVLDGVLDALDVDRADVVGHSTGGYWGLAFALARPGRVRRLVAVGGVPAFPGTSPPIPLRLFTLPMVARLLVPRGHPTEATVVEQLAAVGEDRTIRRYPELVAARVAHDRNPRASAVGVSELKSFMTLGGWRAGARLTPSELRAVERPTTFVWGDEDFLGTPEAVREAIESMPDSRLETLACGHIPWLGHPDACADAVAAARA
ncbi:alpha/beta fold hydrolase [Haloferax sp. KTX1]|uniref:alpha/beta fold hydrolase n=1 Tax=Haloferax sp. KTX1 TaxID=2600597 RepID=UPI0011DD5C75|nr:alpha/beta hydrolase [Haloferax sp. KTX1]